MLYFCTFIRLFNISSWLPCPLDTYVSLLCQKRYCYYLLYIYFCLIFICEFIFKQLFTFTYFIAFSFSLCLSKMTEALLLSANMMDRLLFPIMFLIFVIILSLSLFFVFVSNYILFTRKGVNQDKLRIEQWPRYWNMRDWSRELRRLW